MKIIDLFGEDALPTHEWILQFEPQKPYHNGGVKEYAEFLNQPMSIDMFVRPIPEVGIDTTAKKYFQDLEKHENWQPIFEGEWEYLGVSRNGDIALNYNGSLKTLIKDSTLNDFLSQVKGLKFNKDYELDEPKLFSKEGSDFAGDIIDSKPN